MLTLEDILAATRAVAQRARAGATPAAAAAELRRRAEAAAAHLRLTGRTHPYWGDGSVAAAARQSDDAPVALTEVELLRAGAAVCAEWAGSERPVTTPLLVE